MTAAEATRAPKARPLVKNRAAFEKQIRARLRKAKLDVSAPLFNAIIRALSERDEAADVCMDKNGRTEPDPDLRDTENVPLKEDVHTYFDREVKPHVADAWLDETKTRIGYEIPFTRHFYKYKALRPLAEIEAEIRQLEGEIQGMLSEVLS